MTAGTQEVREHLLALLLAKPGVSVSGEAISRERNMTRAAVWKHMQALQQEGWPIESIPRKGYRLKEKALYPYSAAAISAALREQQITFPWRVSLAPRVDSTSSRLKAAAAEGMPEGAALFAETQTGGRGRMGRQWSSRPGQGIWMSVLLRPDLAPGQVQTLTLAASVAVMQALRDEFGELVAQGAMTTQARDGVLADLGVKWPNDILWRGRKLCGILTELAAEPERLSHVVIGIGINVTHTEEDFSEELQQTATSLRQMLHAAATPLLTDRNRLAAHLLRRLAELYGRLLSGELAVILAQWREMSVTLGRDILVLDAAGSRRAKAIDIGEDGRLLVVGADGKPEWLLSGEISIRNVSVRTR